MNELEQWANYRDRLQSKLEIILSKEYKPLPYYKEGGKVDSRYAGKAWATLKGCISLYAELPERRGN